MKNKTYYIEAIASILLDFDLGTIRALYVAISRIRDRRQHGNPK